MEDRLPYDPKSMAWPFMDVTIGRPPFVPRINATPAVRQSLGDICAATVMCIQDGLREKPNPIRGLTYNILAENGYDNRTFGELLTLVVTCIEAEMVRNNYQCEVGDIAYVVIPDAVAIYIGVIAIGEPGLRHYVDQNMYEAACREGSRYNDVFNKAKNVIASATRQQDAAPTYGSRVTGNITNRQPFATGARTVVTQTRSISRAPLPREQEEAPVEISAWANNDANQGIAPGGFVSKSKLAALVRVKPVEKIAVAPAPKKEQVKPATLSDWRRSETQPYLLGFSPYVCDQQFVRKGDAVYQDIQPRRPGVNFERHSEPYPSHLSSHAWKTNHEKVVEQNKLLIDAITAGKDMIPTFKEGDVFIEEIFFPDSSIESAITYGRIKGLMKMNEVKTLKVYGFASILKSYFFAGGIDEVTWDKDVKILEQLSTQATFVKVRDLIGKFSDDFKRLHSRKLTALLLKQVNFILNHNLSTTIELEDFIDDIADVDEAVHNEYGRLVYDAWVRRQAEAIANMFHRDANTEQLDIEGAEEVRRFSFDNYCQFMLLNLSSGELDIEIPAGKSVIIDPSACQPLFDLIAECIPASVNGVKPAHRYIVTSDGLVLEVVDGWLSLKGMDDIGCYLARIASEVQV